MRNGILQIASAWNYVLYKRKLPKDSEIWDIMMWEKRGLWVCGRDGK